MKWIIVILILATVLIAGCTQTQQSTNQAVVCNSPYIRYGAGCCLDTNSNNICDSDETKENPLTNINFIGTIRLYNPGSISSNGELSLTLESRWPNPISVTSIRGFYPNDKTITWTVDNIGFMPGDKKLVKGTMSSGYWDTIGAVKGSSYNVTILIFYRDVSDNGQYQTGGGFSGIYT